MSGTPELLVPDNLRSGVTKACRYEPEVNRSYHDLALHYDFCVPPLAEERATLSALDRDWDVLWKRMTPVQQKAWETAINIAS